MTMVRFAHHRHQFGVCSLQFVVSAAQQLTTNNKLPTDFTGGKVI